MSTALVPATSSASRDPRFDVLENTALGTGRTPLPPPVVELCLAYARSRTFFVSVPEFLRYFQKHDKLAIAAGEPLVIRDMSVLFRLHDEDPDLLPSNPFHKCLFMLNKILALVAKRGLFEDGNCTLNLSEERLAFKFDRDVTLQTQKALITIRPKHLFEMMRAYRAHEIHFAPNQALVLVGVTAEPGTYLKWQKWAPMGWTIKLKINPGIRVLKNVMIDTECDERTLSQQGFLIRPQQGMNLSIKRPLALVPMPNRLSDLPVIRMTEDMLLQQDMTFNNPNAVVVIERNLIGPGRKVSIVARNVIMSPHATIRVGELDVQTTGASLLFNVHADRLRLVAGKDAVVANSHARWLVVNAIGHAGVHGLNWPHPINLRPHLGPIFGALRDVPFHALPFLLNAPQPSLALLDAPASDAKVNSNAAASSKK